MSTERQGPSRLVLVFAGLFGASSLCCMGTLYSVGHTVGLWP